MDCSVQPQQQQQQATLDHELDDYVTQMYPKNKHLKYICKMLTAHHLINDQLFFVPFPNVHIADFCSFLNNRFNNKSSKPNSTMIKLCRYLQQLHLKMPKVAIKNPLAQKYLT